MKDIYGFLTIKKVEIIEKADKHLPETIRLVLNLYLNNRVFLSRNYRLIVAPRKFDVFKTNICPRSEA